MRRPALLVAISAFSAIIAIPAFDQAAQPQTEPSDPRFKAECESRPDGHAHFTVTNLSQIPITAMVIQPLRASGSYGVVSSNGWTFDGLEGVATRSGPIAPFGKYSFPGTTPCPQTPGNDPVNPGFAVAAILFADGSSVGDAKWVSAVVQSREWLWEDANGALAYIEKAKAGTVPIGQLINELNDKATALRRARARTARDASLFGHFDIYRALASNLAPPKNSPADDQWDLAPHIEFVSDELMNLRQQLFYSIPQIPGANAATASAVPPKPTNFVIHLANDVSSSTLAVQYKLIMPDQNSSYGHPFASPGHSRAPSAGPHEYVIPSDYDGRPAEILLAAVYSPGCQIMTIVVPSLADSSRSADYHCQVAMPVDLTGHITSSDVLAGRKYQVEINFSGLVTLPGTATLNYSFPAAKVIPDDKRGFHAQVPGLTDTLLVGPAANETNPRLVFSLWDQSPTSPSTTMQTAFAYLTLASNEAKSPYGVPIPRAASADLTFAAHQSGQN